MLGRLQFRRIGRQKDEAQALGDFEMRTGVPAGAIEQQDDAFVLAGPDGSGEALEHGGERHQIDGGAQEPLDGAAAGVNETVEVEPLRAGMGGGHGDYRKFRVRAMTMGTEETSHGTTQTADYSRCP